MKCQHGAETFCEDDVRHPRGKSKSGPMIVIVIVSVVLGLILPTRCPATDGNGAAVITLHDKKKDSGAGGRTMLTGVSSATIELFAEGEGGGGALCCVGLPILFIILAIVFTKKDCVRKADRCPFRGYRWDFKDNRCPHCHSPQSP